MSGARIGARRAEQSGPYWERGAHSMQTLSQLSGSSSSVSSGSVQGAASSSQVHEPLAQVYSQM